MKINAKNVFITVLTLILYSGISCQIPNYASLSIPAAATDQFSIHYPSGHAYGKHNGAYKLYSRGAGATISIIPVTFNPAGIFDILHL
jgi:hypothetical protein